MKTLNLPLIEQNSGFTKGHQALPVQQQQGINLDALKGQWQQKIGAAKVTWGRLTEDELMQSEGQGQKLAGLIQERYAITREAAEKQIEDFLGKDH